MPRPKKNANTNGNGDSKEAPEKRIDKYFKVKPPEFAEAVFEIIGTEILVIHRMSMKLKAEFLQKIETGRPAGNKKIREPKPSKQAFEESRYRLQDGSDGFHAGSIRNAMIDACRLTGAKMVLAKLSVFVLQDGYDRLEPQIPLIRIHGKAVMQQDFARVATGEPYITTRASYRSWKAYVHLRWDAEQFTESDIYNLLQRVGMQVGIGEGRYNSKNSPGQGWGCFKIGKVSDITQLTKVA